MNYVLRSRRGTVKDMQQGFLTKSSATDHNRASITHIACCLPLWWLWWMSTRLLKLVIGAPLSSVLFLAFATCSTGFAGHDVFGSCFV